jgi:galactokinase
VGTFGGSEDHTAMLCARAGEMSQYSFCPVRHERQVPMPTGHLFVVAVSGVTAEKTGAAKDAYNRASIAVRSLLDAWNGATGRSAPSLAAAVSNGAAGQLDALVERAAGGIFTRQVLRARFEQFVEESDRIVPAAGDALAAGDLTRFGTLVDRSQYLAERLLGNQVPETAALAASARDLGAAAASAFGAGFGGSVWALVSEEAAGEFIDRWRSGYAAAFPAAARNAAFLSTRPGPAAQEMSSGIISA